MPYVSTTGTEYHERRRCRRLHATGGRIRRVEDTDGLDECDHCVEGPDTTDDGEGVTVAEVEAIGDAVIADRIDEGRCPWCDEYEGEHVGQHAASAHPDAWDDYKNDD